MTDEGREDIICGHTGTVMHAHGTVTYRVGVGRYLGDNTGRWIGWVGDGREFDGSRLGELRWWACWREDGDDAARWTTGLDYERFTEARDALVAARAADLRGSTVLGTVTGPESRAVADGS